MCKGGSMTCCRKPFRMLDNRRERAMASRDIYKGASPLCSGTPARTPMNRKPLQNTSVMNECFILDPDNAYAGLVTVPTGISITSGASQAKHWVPCRTGFASTIQVYSEASLHTLIQLHPQTQKFGDSKSNSFDQVFEPCSDCSCRGQPCSVMKLADKGKLQSLSGAEGVQMSGNVIMVNWDGLRKRSLRERAESAAGLLCM